MKEKGIPNPIAEQLAGVAVSVLIFALCCAMLVLFGYCIALVVGGRDTFAAWFCVLGVAGGALLWYFAKPYAAPSGAGRCDAAPRPRESRQTKKQDL